MLERLIVTDSAVVLSRRGGRLDDTAYLDLALPGRATDVLDHLERSGSRRLDRVALFRRFGPAFREGYISFMGALNRDNASFDWWTHDFATRNALATDLSENVFYTFLVDRILSDDSEENGLVVVTESADLAAQLARVAAGRQIRSVRAQSGRPSVGRRFTEWLPFWPIAYTVRSFSRVRKVRRSIAPPADEGPYVVLATLINHQSFDAQGSYSDTYFGALADTLAAKGVSTLVFGALGRDFDDDLARLMRASPPYPVVPIQYYLTPLDLFACFVRSLARFFAPTRIAGSTLFMGVDVEYLIRRHARRDASRAYYTHLQYHYCAKALARRLEISAFAYPFENRPFEKMYLLAVQAADPRPLLVGYNHATVTPKHLNLVLAAEEESVMPLPDLLMTVGEVTRRWLVEDGGFPADRVRAGCGLRHKMPRDVAFRPRARPLSDLLVILTAEVPEYLRILGFLANAFPGGSGSYRVMIRPHPITPLARALDLMPPLPFEFEDVSAPRLEEVLERSDAVLYTSSTVALEALAHGTPVVYLDTGEHVRVDPLVGLEAFRFDAADPKDLGVVLAAIDTMPDAEYAAAQEAAARYAREYILPPSDENVGAFVEVLTGGHR